MLRELEHVNCLEGAALISSLWFGYLIRDSGKIDKMKSMGITHAHIHTSGHATPRELERFVAAFKGARIVPIHLDDTKGFQDLFPDANIKNDVEWWSVKEKVAHA